MVMVMVICDGHAIVRQSIVSVRDRLVWIMGMDEDCNVLLSR